jgi:Sap, sulfolipid-1-addressing protein
MLAIDPLRLGLILLLISRPRPLQSLLAYWAGAIFVSATYMLIPLMALHAIPSFRSFTKNIATSATAATFANPTVQHIQLGMGAVALLIAAVMAIRLRAGQYVYAATPADTTSTVAADSATSTANTQPLGHTQDAPKQGPIRRLRARALGAWDSESPRAALIVGLMSGPPPVTVLLVLTTIMASDAAIGAQVIIAIAWIFGMFAVAEIILVSYLASPRKTKTVLRLLHDWVLAHRRHVWIALISVVGVVLLAYGMGVTGAGAG